MRAEEPREQQANACSQKMRKEWHDAHRIDEPGPASAPFPSARVVELGQISGSTVRSHQNEETSRWPRQT